MESFVVDEQHQIRQQAVGDEVVVIRPSQALDNTNAHEMVDLISTAQMAGCRYIIIDMADLEFLSSAGVGSILGTVETSREAGGDIILCDVSATIMHILQVLDLHEFLTIMNNRQEAGATCGVEI